jgi:hypothetical protein
MTDQHIATALFALPFLALAIGGAIAQIALYRADHNEQLARIRSARVMARREGR